MKKRAPAEPRRAVRSAPRTRRAGSARATDGHRSGASTAAGTRAPRKAMEAVPVTVEELRQLQRELERRLGPSSGGTRAARKGRPGGAAPLRWNPDPEDLQRSVAQLVLTIVEFLRRLMERQAVRRMETGTLTREEVEAVGAALMMLERTVRDIGVRFGLTPEDLNLDLGSIKLM
ncbi:MAG: gas vesicle protein K [Vicinamibacterales bacterium]